MATYLSGIQPSGLPHLGNYFGAISQHIALPERGGEHFYFIADYHALTTIRDPAELRTRVFEIAGHDPKRFRTYRCLIVYPVPFVSLTAWFKLPDESSP